MPREPRPEAADLPAGQDEVMENNAATGGRPDDPIRRGPRSRVTAGDDKRAAAKAAGVASASTKTGLAGRMPPVPRGRLDKGEAAAGSAVTEPMPRVRLSNAEIAEASTLTARRRPAARAARTEAGFASDSAREGAAGGKRSGGARQRVPAPGTAATMTKREAITGERRGARAGERSTSSTGGPKPPKRTARAGRPSGAERSKGSDGGLAD